MKLKFFSVIGFALVALLVGCKGSATENNTDGSALTAANLLPADEVKRVLKAEAIEEVAKVPIGEGISHNYLFPGKAKLIFLLSTQGENYDSLKKDYDELDPSGGDSGAIVLGNTRDVPGIREKCFYTQFKIDAKREESKSDEILLMFKKGKYLVELKSVSRVTDSGHLARPDLLMKLARMVDKKIPAPATANE